jgi:hypothetical protein
MAQDHWMWELNEMSIDVNEKFLKHLEQSKRHQLSMEKAMDVKQKLGTLYMA